MAVFVAGVVAIVQFVFLALLLAFLVVRRFYDRRQRAAFDAGRGEVAIPLRAWLVGGASAAPVVAVLRRMPRGTAVGYLALLARQTIPDTNRDELADALRGEAWLEAAVRRSGSRFWWRRLEAARALSLMAESRDRAAVLGLFFDPHPAVQIAAAGALPRVADPASIGNVLDRLDGLPKVVRHYVTTVLRRSRALVGPELARRIDAATHFAPLASWIELAEAIDDPAALDAALRRAAHPATPVRRTVARALRRFPGPGTETALVLLLGDKDASVRAAACRTLGELGGRDTVEALAPMLSDPIWVVRVRAAISLAQLGERGRAVLRTARAGQDRFARDMATMVTGLSEGAVLEMGDA